MISLGPAGSTQLPAIRLAALILARRATTSAGTTVGGSVLRLGFEYASLRFHWEEATLEVELGLWL